MDVLFHLDDEAAINHLQLLFHLSKRYVLIYAPNHSGEGLRLASHMHFREFLPIIKKKYKLKPAKVVKNKYLASTGAPDTSYADFFLFDLKGDEKKKST